MTDSEQLGKLALQYTEQGQAAMANLVHTMWENWANAVRTVSGLGSSATSSQLTPAEVIDRTYDFTIQMIETQRTFAHQLLESGLPVVQAMEQATDSVTDKVQQGTATGSGTASGEAAGETASR